MFQQVGGVDTMCERLIPQGKEEICSQGYIRYSWRIAQGICKSLSRELKGELDGAKVHVSEGSWANPVYTTLSLAAHPGPLLVDGGGGWGRVSAY